MGGRRRRARRCRLRAPRTRPSRSARPGRSASTAAPRRASSAGARGGACVVPRRSRRCVRRRPALAAVRASSPCARGGACVVPPARARGASWRRPSALAALRGVVRRPLTAVSGVAPPAPGASWRRPPALAPLRGQRIEGVRPARPRGRLPAFVRGRCAGGRACWRVSSVLCNTSRAAGTNCRWLASKSGANPRQFAGAAAAGRAKVLRNRTAGRPPRTRARGRGHAGRAGWQRPTRRRHHRLLLLIALATPSRRRNAADHPKAHTDPPGHHRATGAARGHAPTGPSGAQPARAGSR
jgi:hypothetical protein